MCLPWWSPKNYWPSCLSLQHSRQQWTRFHEMSLSNEIGQLFRSKLLGQRHVGNIKHWFLPLRCRRWRAHGDWSFSFSLGECRIRSILSLRIRAWTQRWYTFQLVGKDRSKGCIGDSSPLERISGGCITLCWLLTRTIYDCTCRAIFVQMLVDVTRANIFATDRAGESSMKQKSTNCEWNTRSLAALPSYCENAEKVRGNYLKSIMWSIFCILYSEFLWARQRVSKMLL